MIYAVGDIHGQCEKLKLLLKLLDDDGMQSDDTLVFIGDYVDRGPDSKGVLDLLLDLKGPRPKTIFLRGNHEQMMLDGRQRFDPRFDSNNPSLNCDSGVYWFHNGGTETVASYGKAKGKRWFELIPKDHWDFLLSTQLEYEEDGYLFVHAGVVPPEQNGPRLISNAIRGCGFDTNLLRASLTLADKPSSLATRRQRIGFP